MVTLDKIRAYTDRIVREFHPDKIILFGSYAEGNPGAESDVDLLVILPFKGKGTYKSLEILDRLKTDIPIDLIARTPEQLAERLAVNDFFLRAVMEKGTILYEVPHGRMD